MKRSEAAKYARWSAATALVFAGLTVGVYLYRGYTRLVDRRNAPPPAPVDVERQSTGLTFSKGEGTRKVFTVEASKSIDFKGLNTSDLEGVKITVFGKEGARHDTMETHTCRYTKDSGDILCAGDVEIILLSADEFNAAGGKMDVPTAMKIETKGVSFNRASGEAKTDAEVRFTFASGSGQAVGADYYSEQGTLQLRHDVRMKLIPAADAKGKYGTAGLKSEPVDVTGSRMNLSRDAGTIYLAGPAEAKTQTSRLTSAAMLVEMDAEFHAKRLLAKSGGGMRAEFSSLKSGAKQRLSADEMVATFAPEGWITQAEANGNVDGESSDGDERRTVKAQNASMEMVAGENAPKLLVLKGAVDLRTAASGGGKNAVNGSAPGDARKLTTEELRLLFRANEKVAGKNVTAGTRLETAETVGAGRVELNEAANETAKASQTVVQANQLGMKFDAAGKASRLDAKGNVQTERNFFGADKPGSADKQTVTAKNGFVEMNGQGGWSRMELSEDVHLKDGPRAAAADHAVFARAEQTVTLEGRASVRDATSLTSAQKLTFWQATGELRGEGGVRSTDLSSKGGTIHLAPVAANVSAEQLNGNSKSGRVVYLGHARLWQGDSVMEAESIELLKNERMLNAVGSVRAVFPQAPGKNVAGSGTSPDAENKLTAVKTSGAKPPVLWHAQAAKLSYWDGENRARLEQNVVVQSAEEKISSAAMDLYFTRGQNGGNRGTASGSNGAAGLAGAQQISRAVGTGGVMVQQGERRATAERGEYTATDGKFVMSGGTPTLFDAEEGTTTGRQLTFFLADATIIVDTEKGSRTLTKHRVEK